MKDVWKDDYLKDIKTDINKSKQTVLWENLILWSSKHQ